MPAGKKLIQGLQEAKHSLTDPEAFPPEPTARNLAEGYRYRLAHLGRLIEMEMRLDPRYPEFYRSMAMLRQWRMGRCVNTKSCAKQSFGDWCVSHGSDA